MNSFAILTNRKRAIIALIHSIAFLLIAARGTSSPPLTPIWLPHESLTAPVLMLVIYLIVSSILWQLTRVSRCFIERLYFGFCSLSATAGLLRTILGDPPMHLAIVFRVLMLTSAVITGFVILREHSEPELAE